MTASNVTSQDALVSRLAKLTVQGRDINNDPAKVGSSSSKAVARHAVFTDRDNES